MLMPLNKSAYAVKNCPPDQRVAKMREKGNGRKAVKSAESLPKHLDINNPKKSNSSSGFLGIDKDAQGATDRFMAKLTGNGFIMSLSKNTGINYTEKKQTRDSMAVSEFTKTKVFNNILKLR